MMSPTAPHRHSGRRADPAPDPVDEIVADVFARACPSRQILATVVGKWGVLALAALHESGYRFNALRRRIDGVSEKMLAQTLQALERDGLVNREAQLTIPPRVEYSLTPLGRRVAGRLQSLIDLLESEMPEVLAAQQRYDRERGGESGGPHPAG
jgi:DNA-binding HxlR family transcriptional regulator